MYISFLLFCAHAWRLKSPLKWRYAKLSRGLCCLQAASCPWSQVISVSLFGHEEIGIRSKNAASLGWIKSVAAVVFFANFIRSHQLSSVQTNSSVCVFVTVFATHTEAVCVCVCSCVVCCVLCSQTNPPPSVYGSLALKRAQRNAARGSGAANWGIISPFAD